MESLHAFSDIEPYLNYLAPQYIDKVEQAFVYASVAHQGQARITGEAYITHPLAVAKILAGLRLDHDTIIAGLLHDVVEDTGITIQQIVQEFGDDVGLMVDGVTKMTKLKYKAPLSYQAENYRKMFMAMAKDIRVIFIKLADRLHNMRTCQVLSTNRKRRIARETLEIYAPLAKRLGMHNLSMELDELGFAAYYPGRYAILMENMYRINSGQVDVLSHLSHQIKTQAKASQISLRDISFREKQLYGIYQKMRTKRARFSELMDVYALRITVSSVGDCYAVLGLVHGLYRPKDRHLKDYIAAPKQNGYQSIHTVLHGPYGVPIEIQIRTAEMHLVATKGVAAHWVYKSGTSMLNQNKRQNWFKRIVKAQEVCKDDADYLQIVKHQIFSEEVYILTPKGKVQELKRGATVLDMAYHIHTDIGNHAVYAKVDQVHAPLGQVLRNGQTVEVFTDHRSHPTEEWLELVMTAKARSSIRQYIKDQKSISDQCFGRRQLEGALTIKGVDSISENVLEKMAAVHRVDHVKGLYQKLYVGECTLPELVQLYDTYAHSTDDSSTVLKIDVVGDGVVEAATCCYPIYGDRIAGLKQGQQLLLHRKSCRMLERLNEQATQTQWGNVEQLFETVLTVEMVNKNSNIAYVVSMLTDMKAIIQSFATREIEGRVVLLFKIKVSSLEHLSLIMQSLNQIKMVHLVKRESRCGLLLLDQV